jgi:hypothetical protein
MLRFILILTAVLMPLLFASFAYAGPFIDVQSDPWDGRYDAIDKLQSEGFINGYPDGRFRGDQPFTRYEMAVLVARISNRLLSEISDIEPAVKDVLNSPAGGKTEMSFTDVPSGHWAYESVMMLENLGLLIGEPDGRFDGDRGVTRFEFYVIFNRLFERLPSYFIEGGYHRGSDIEPVFSDLPADHWAYHDIVSLLKIGGFDTYPDDSIRGSQILTRDEMAFATRRMFDRLAAGLEDEERRMESL